MTLKAKILKRAAREANIADIMENTERVGDCIMWLGLVLRKPNEAYSNYPIIRHRNKQWKGNRLVWTLLHGPIPKGVCILHKCDQPRCINPDHLWAGTLKDNIRDAVKKKRHSESRKTHCKRGHILGGDNLQLPRRKDGRVYRSCRTCIWYRNHKLPLNGKTAPWERLLSSETKERDE